MADRYGILSQRFWDGPTGRQLQDLGRDAVILAAYLATCRHANMIGLYELPLVFVERELTVLKGKPVLLKALQAVEEAEFAVYDSGTEHVWVREMARIRLGLERGETIKSGDNRHPAVVKLYAAARPNPFLAPFYDRYRTELRLTHGRTGPTRTTASPHGARPASPVRPHDPQGDTKGLTKPLQGDSKPEQVQVQNSNKYRDQEQDQKNVQAAAAPPRPEKPVENPDDNVGVITTMVVKDILPLHLPESELMEATKERCAKLGLAYNSGVVRKAVDSALVRVMKRSKVAS